MGGLDADGDVRHEGLGYGEGDVEDEMDGLRLASCHIVVVGD